MNHKIKLVWSMVLLTLGITLCSAAQAKKPCCPKCSTPCTLKVEQDEEENYCWLTKSKTVCIPKVRFSWQRLSDPKYVASGHAGRGSGGCGSSSCDSSCCNSCKPPLLGKSRTVCVLEKHTYECPKCKYTWEPVETKRCCSASSCAQNTNKAQTANGTQIASKPLQGAINKTAKAAKPATTNASLQDRPAPSGTSQHKLVSGKKLGVR